LLVKMYSRWAWYWLKWYFGFSQLKPLSIARVTRPVGGFVELFQNEADEVAPYRLRYTSPSGKKQAMMLNVLNTAKAVMNNWAHGETDVPWRVVLTAEEQQKIFKEV
jgi:hypothetical protein